MKKKVSGNMVVWALLFMVISWLLIMWYYIYFNNTMFKHEMNQFIINLWIGSAENS